MEVIRDFVVSQIVEAEKRNNIKIPQNLSNDIKKMLENLEIACYCQGFSDGVMFNSGINNF